jgi:hypothetical protein
MATFDHSLSALSTQHSTLSFALVAFALVLLSSCGYQFAVEGPGPTIGGTTLEQAQAQANAPTLAIQPLENRSSEPNLELKYATYIQREFASGSGTRVVTGSAPSDLVFKGRIVSVIIPTLTFSIGAASQTLESRVTVIVQAVVEDTRTKRPIWSELVTGSSEYFVTKDLQFNQMLQNRALEQAGIFLAADLAARFQNHLDTYGFAPSPPGPPALPPAGVPREGRPAVR